MDNKLEQGSFLFMLVLITGLFLLLMKPFFAPLFWACAISLLFYPLQQRLKQRWGQRPNTNALVTLLICMFVVVIPVLLILAAFLQEAVGLYQRIDSGELKPGAFLDKIRDALPAVQTLLDRFSIDLESIRARATEAAVAGSKLIAQNALALGQGMFQFFLKLCLMLYVTFFLLRDGHKLIEQLIRALPLGDERERLLLNKFAEVTRATVKGNLVVAIVQGALGGLIFLLLGIPGPVLWGVTMAILSLIPAIGAGLIWLPAAIYLYASGQWISATILALYGFFVIGLADNILRPILVGRDTKLPDWLVLLSTLGGLAMFGINGFIVGPLIAALFVVFWQIFSRDFNQSTRLPDNAETPELPEVEPSATKYQEQQPARREIQQPLNKTPSPEES